MPSFIAIVLQWIVSLYNKANLGNPNITKVRGRDSNILRLLLMQCPEVLQQSIINEYSLWFMCEDSGMLRVSAFSHASLFLLNELII